MSDIDTTLLLTVGFLVVAGIGIFATASVVLSQQETGSPYTLLWQQLLSIGLGVVLFYIMQRVDYRRLRPFALPLFLVSVVLLVLVFVPGLGITHGGSTRWIRIANFSFQPSELAKLGMVMILATLFAVHGKRRGLLPQKTTLPVLVVLGLVTVPLVLQPDIGTLGVFVVTAILLFFIAGGRWSHVLGLLGLGAAGFVTLIRVAPYRFNRLMTFLHPELDPQGIGYQINQALLAIGSGGIVGRGWGHSRQKHEYLPEPAGDSIFAIAAEELGFLGAAAIVVAFLFLMQRCWVIARNAPDAFGRFLVSGIMIWVTTQAFLNIGSLTGLLPLTGIPLPLISMGGSAMVVTLGALGIVANISKHTI